MATPSMQVCVDTSDWLKGIVSDDVADNSNSSSPSATELIGAQAPPPVLDRRLRPAHDQALKCPRCESTHTKFCYYNNYSLSQPRYFCKTCRRYWTKGGTLRNVPVGGGCRKNKRSSSSAAAAKKPAELPQSLLMHQPTDLQLSNLNFMFMDNVGSGYANSLGFSIDGGHDSFAEACNRLQAFPFEAAQEEAEEAVEMKPGNRMLSLEWPEPGCGDPYGHGHGMGLWAGMINGHGHGHGPSSAAM